MRCTETKRKWWRYQPHSNENKKYGHSPHDYTQSTRGASNEPKNSTIESARNGKISSNEENERNQISKITDAEIVKYTHSLARWTKALVFVGSITAVILFFQYCTLEKTDQTQRAANRAFVFVKQTYWAHAAGSAEYRYIAEWENSGNTPPDHMTVQIACIHSDWGESDPLTVKNATLSDKFSRVMGPKQTVIGGYCIFSSEQMIDGQSGKMHLYFFTKAEYSDVYDPTYTHVTEYCIEFREIKASDIQPNALSLGIPCDTHNCTDENCRKK
jgi:hypothetical protein